MNKLQLATFIRDSVYKARHDPQDLRYIVLDMRDCAVTWDSYQSLRDELIRKFSIKESGRFVILDWSSR